MFRGGQLAYCAPDPPAVALGAAFLEEAQVMWRAERTADSVLNAAALFLFALAVYVRNADGVVPPDEPLEDGRRMAERLSLFGARPTGENAAIFDGLADECKK